MPWAESGSSPRKQDWDGRTFIKSFRERPSPIFRPCSRSSTTLVTIYPSKRLKSLKVAMRRWLFPTRKNPMKIEKAKLADSSILAEMNYSLIRDEGHRNPMNRVQLMRRMRNWLKGKYRAFLFKEQGKIIGYCLFRKEEGFIYLRQFFIIRNFRKKGLGKKAFKLLLKG